MEGFEAFMGQFEAFIGINFWTALFVLLNTLTIFFVGKKKLFDPVSKMIEDRQQEIDDMYAKAESAQTDAEALQAQYQQKLDVAADTAAQMVKDAVDRSQRREEEILLRANAEADAIRKKASEDIAMEKKKAINEAKDEISVIALAIAGKVVGRELQESDQSQLVDSFIDQLGDQV